LRAVALFQKIAVAPRLRGGCAFRKSNIHRGCAPVALFDDQIKNQQETSI
jgi:hypothetical protein